MARDYPHQNYSNINKYNTINFYDNILIIYLFRCKNIIKKKKNFLTKKREQKNIFFASVYDLSNSISII